MGNSCVRGRWGFSNDGFLQTVSNYIPGSKTNHDFSLNESVIPTIDVINQPPEEVRIVREEPEANRTQTEQTRPKNSVQENKKVEEPAIIKQQVLPTKTLNIKEHYSLGKKLGDGRFGTTFLCVEKATGKEYACKSISKTTLRTREDVEDVRREIQIMHRLAGNSNVVAIKGAYEDSVAVHLVMELCEGGELYDRLIKNGHCTEKKAAQLARTIVSVVESCHSLGIMHRDLKPENFLFVNDEEDSPLKAIDFGLSTMFKPGETLTELVGSLFYIAPEVLRKNYGPEADVWSAGVMIYILLSGLLPFFAEKDPDLCAAVLNGRLNFSSDPWPSISDSAKDLVKKMLVKDPKKRPTASQVLRHPWLQIDGIAPDKPLDSAVLTKLKQFSAMNKLKKKALRVIAESLPVDEISGFTEIFERMDTKNIGQITIQELKDGLRSLGPDHDEAEIYDLLIAADFDNIDAIQYSEFIAAMVHLNEIESEDHLSTAFSYFDRDGSGFITRCDLEAACQEFGIENVHSEEMIHEFDQNNDGQIDYSEFVAMMRNCDVKSLCLNRCSCTD